MKILAGKAPAWRVAVLLIGLFSLLSSAQAQVEVKDDLGRGVVLSQPAQRIVSLAPNITELLFMLGAGEAITGADEFSNYPEQAKQILRVSNYAAANYELIISLQPDLVIAWQTGNGESIIGRLQQLGVPLFIIEPQHMDDIPGLFLRLGRLTGRETVAEKKAAQFTARIEALRESYGNKEVVSVFYQIWNEPLITLNGQHLVSDVLRLCAGRNVFADAAPLVPYVNIEAVLAAQPQAIIASGSSDDAPTWLGMWNAWPSIPAVQNKQVYFIPPDYMQRHSMRILDGAEQVCQFLENTRNSAHKSAAEDGLTD